MQWVACLHEHLVDDIIVGAALRRRRPAGPKGTAWACPLQLLRLQTAAIAERWRFRYVGTLGMHKLSIERLPS
ncbi:MAG: hypothetical protein EOR07_02530 [Mesorhizobium sp.]|nr:MAG: hypothetical protein EOR07_02530 [Mesorhizobium sp.]